MASSPSPLLRLELMATGENANTWGGKANTDFSLLEQAIAGRADISLSNSNVTLTSANYASDQSRMYCLALTGVLSANVSVIVPNLSHAYLVENLCTGSFTVTVKTASGTGIVCAQNAWTAVYCNGTNVVQPVSAAADANTLGGLTSAQYARLAFFNQFQKGSGHNFTTLSDGSTVTVDCTLADRFYLNIQGNRTLALNSPADGQTIKIWVQQDATGGRTLALPSNVSGSILLAGAPDAITELELTYNTNLDTWVAKSNSGGAVSATLTANEANVRLFERLGSPSDVVTVDVTIAAGTVISSNDTATAALDLSGFASGSTINLVNNGLIVGKGGSGGNGGACGDCDGGGSLVRAGTAGEAGGPAIKGPGSGRTLNIYNGSGYIWGGGGGGGGGGGTSSVSASAAAGGGGGGGAGGGLRGQPGSHGSAAASTATGSTGVSGSTGLTGGAGTGGAGANTGTATGGAGGNGGDFGAAGSAGSASTAQALDAAGGAGGAAGKAVDVNGGSASFVSGSGSPNVKGAVS